MIISLFYQFPTWMQRLYPGVTWRMDPNSKTIYLTFDDGPTPDLTLDILGILAVYNAKATFFLVGENAERNPELVQEILRQGHRVANHTYHHLKGLITSTDDYIKDVNHCQAVIDRAYQDFYAANPHLKPSAPADKSFRPPYGRMTQQQKQALVDAGYTTYLWDVLTHDYNPRYTSDHMVDVVERLTRPGSIITFHDSIKANKRMLDAFTCCIDYWIAHGYKLATLP